MPPAERRSPVLGVVVLEAAHAVDTLEHPAGEPWVPPPGLGPGFFGHPEFWPCRTVFAVADGATGAASAAGEVAAARGVARAVRRLEGRCDLIIGGCGYFGDAWPELVPRPDTFTVLSALDLLDATLAATPRHVVVLSASSAAGWRAVRSHPQADRIRVVGLDGLGEWAAFGRDDWATSGLVSEAGLVQALRTVLAAAADGGDLVGAGALVLECTVLPQFTAVIREYADAPIVDLAAHVRSLLG